MREKRSLVVIALPIIKGIRWDCMAESRDVSPHDLDLKVMIFVSYRFSDSITLQR